MNGALLWERRYNGPANDRDSASAIAVDGALLWEKRYNGVDYDQAAAVAVDGSGDVIVTGPSYDTNNNYNYYTAKYAAADGALLWEKRYNGPANSYDSASALAVDGSGNVVVTGVSEGTGTTGFDYYTAKYAAAGSGKNATTARRAARTPPVQ